MGNSVQHALTWAQAMGAFNRGEYRWARELFESIGEYGMADWVQLQAAGVSA